jgi:hypothetical protein
MMLHRKETERLSNTRKWRLFQVGLWLIFVIPWTTLQCIGVLIGTPIRLAMNLYDWNRCPIESRKRHWTERVFK